MDYEIIMNKLPLEVFTCPKWCPYYNNGKCSYLEEDGCYLDDFE